MDRVNLLATTAICVCFANLAFVGAAKGSCIGYYAPLVSGSYAGQTAEIATLTNYSALCPSSPTTTLCVAGIARAMADAQSYFVNESSTGSGACPHHNMALVLQFPAGTYDISGDHAPVILDDNQNPVVLSLPNNPGPISATERLILAGGGGGGTTLLSDYHWKTIYGTDVLSPRVYSAGVSHVTVSGFTFARNAAPVSQGVLTNVTLNTSDPSNITGSIAIQIQNSPGTNGPASAAQPPNGQPNSNYPNPYPIGFNSPAFEFQGNDGKYLRVYDNAPSSGGSICSTTNPCTPLLDAGVAQGGASHECTLTAGGKTFTNSCNGQIEYSSCEATSSTGSSACSYNSEQDNNNGYSTYTLGIGEPGGTMYGTEAATLMWYHHLLVDNGNENDSHTPVIVCGKGAGEGAGFADVTDSHVGGSDIVFDSLVLKEEAHANIIGIHGFVLTNVSISREPASGSQLPCLATNGGGFQVHGADSSTSDLLTKGTYGNRVDNFTAEATADDTLAFFGDIGGNSYGSPTVTFPQSTIGSSTTVGHFLIDSPFVHAINVKQACNIPAGNGGTNLCFGPAINSNTVAVTNCYLWDTAGACPVNRAQ
jgi:hypothetical protein